MKLKVPVAHIFPLDVVDRLLTTVAVDPFAPPGDSLLREKAINKAVTYAKQRCPELFRKEI